MNKSIKINLLWISDQRTRMTSCPGKTKKFLVWSRARPLSFLMQRHHLLCCLRPTMIELRSLAWCTRKRSNLLISHQHLASTITGRTLRRHLRKRAFRNIHTYRRLSSRPVSQMLFKKMALLVDSSLSLVSIIHRSAIIHLATHANHTSSMP